MADVHDTAMKLKEVLPRLYETLTGDARAINEGDPATLSVEEVIIRYPDFYAIMIYRIAHELDRLIWRTACN